MQLIDPSAPEHSAALAKISDLAKWPHHCVMTRQAVEDIVKSKLTKEALLCAIRDHIASTQPIYTLTQELTGMLAYVFLPCVVDGCSLYVKVQLPACLVEKDERLVVISAHPPKYAPPREKD